MDQVLKGIQIITQTITFPPAPDVKPSRLQVPPQNERSLNKL